LLARGLAVMRCVAESSRPVTIADVSRRIGLSRAAVRRCLHTLNLLGYVGQDARVTSCGGRR
jgi:IclR family pca regulon transcriptional regulator